MLPYSPLPRVLATIGFHAVVLLCSLSAAPRITEFMAWNTSGLLDEDGATTDWIEIHNPDTTTLDLGGYHLTDDANFLQKWTFPAPTILEPGAFLIVFASDKDRRLAGSELHANFKLTSDGEYLGLIAPDGTSVIDDFSPHFPQQFRDISYGLQQQGNVTDETWVMETAPCRARVPTAPIGSSWTTLSYNDTTWDSGSMGVGYDYGNLLGLDVGDAMYNQNSTVYVRVPFTASNLSEISQLTLRTKIDDGFVAYINGAQVASDRAPATLNWNATATADHPDASATTFIDHDITAMKAAVVAGQNILAFHGLNRQNNSSDMLVRAALIATRLTEAQLGDAGYLLRSTPNGINGTELGLPNSEVTFSEASRTFTSTLAIVLSGADEGQLIRYTTDGSVPTITSSPYSAPLSVTGTTQIRARVFTPDGTAGPTSTETYLYLHPDLRQFRSNLPIVILENFGGGRPNSTTTMFMAIIRPDDLGDGFADMTDPFEVATRGTMKVRGSSSAGWPKYSMAIETWDDNDVDQNIKPLDMPAESDWVLGSKYEFDRALMRNDLAYQLSNDLGEYATRTRHVEVINNTGGGNLSYSSDYFGVYSWTEKIKRDDDRVDVERLLPTDDSEPAITGGYLFKKDRLDGGDSGFTVQGQGLLAHVYPKESDITTAQKDWLINYLNEFNAAVQSNDGLHPTNGTPFTDYIIPESWLKHHWINTLTKNVDGFRLSGYYYKDRLGRVGAGPVWDFDRTMQSTDGRDDNPESWDGTGDSSRTWYDNRYVWWGEALEKVDFRQAHTDLWQTQRRDGAFAWAHVEQIIDRFNSLLNTSANNSNGIAATAQARNFARWTSVPPRGGSHASEISILKDWLHTRLDWIDTHYTSMPEFVQTPGLVSSGTSIRFTKLAGSTVYHTTDGTDPRASGGAVSTSASSTTAIHVTASVTVTARARIGSEWSAPIQGSYLVGPLANASNLLVTEVHYAPAAPTAPSELSASADPAAFEFIELRNVSLTDTISLHDVRFVSGIAFDFTGSDVLHLAPGERVLVVAQRTAFEARYGTTHSIAGEFANGTRLDNDGETIQVIDGQGTDIAHFTYNDQHPWPVDAGFTGYSLVLAALNAPDYADAQSWRSSTALGGNPSTHDGSTFTGNATADADADRLNAFLEYALGTSDLMGADGNDAFDLAFADITIEDVPNRYITVSVRRNLAADDAILAVETTPNLLGPWDALTMRLHKETHNGDGTSTLLFRSSTPHLNTDIRAFYRIRATQR